MKRSTKLAALCTAVVATGSLVLPQVAQAAQGAQVEQKIFSATGSSRDDDAAREDAIAKAVSQMKQYAETEDLSCSMREMNVKFKHMLKVMPPIYVWEAKLTYQCV